MPPVSLPLRVNNRPHYVDNTPYAPALDDLVGLGPTMLLRQIVEAPYQLTVIKLTDLAFFVEAVEFGKKVKPSDPPFGIPPTLI